MSVVQPKLGSYAGVILLSVAVCLFTEAVIRELSIRRATISEFPVSLAPGTVRTPAFRIGRADQYDINIEFQPRLERIKMECLLGIAEEDQFYPSGGGPYARLCKDISDLIEVSWAVFGAGEGGEIATPVLYRGTSDDYPAISRFGGLIWRQIGSSRGDQNLRYILVLNIKRDASQLNVADPKILVRVPPSEPKDLLEWVQMFAALILGLIGLVVVWVSHMKHKLAVDK